MQEASDYSTAPNKDNRLQSLELPSRESEHDIKESKGHHVQSYIQRECLG